MTGLVFSVAEGVDNFAVVGFAAEGRPFGAAARGDAPPGVVVLGATPGAVVAVVAAVTAGRTCLPSALIP